LENDPGFLFAQSSNLALLAVLISLIVAVLAWSRRQQRGDDALTVLKRRLARGDISEAEYLRLRALVREDVPTAHRQDEETVDSLSTAAQPDDTVISDILDTSELRRPRDRFQ
jgi:hypothetical protein